MGKLFFPKMAAGNLVRNRRFEFPYLLTGLITVAMFYNMTFLTFHEELKNMPGGATIPTIMNLGTMVVGLFALIFLLYTNTFLMKRRHKEIGLYNILGMSKRHIAVVMLWETVYTCLITVVGGLLLGILLSKLMLLLLYKILFFSVSFGFMVSWKSVGITAVLFVAIYLVALLLNLLHVHLSKPVELLKGGSVGEKEPKTKVLLAILGVVTLGAGYYIAITTESPLEALMLFFLAVILVIIGTYCLFTAGSIAFLKAMKKRKNYYYQAKHFIGISGMLYRMKQNAVGLANICILSTMVLVMISTCVCLYIGTGDALNAMYPHDIIYSQSWQDSGNRSKEEVRVQIQEALDKAGMEPTHVQEVDQLTTVNSMPEEATLGGVDLNAGVMDLSNTVTTLVVTAEGYRQMTGNTLNLAPGEAAIYTTESQGEWEQISFLGLSFSIKTWLPEAPAITVEGYSERYIFLVVADDAAMEAVYQQQMLDGGGLASNIYWEYSLDFDGVSKEEMLQLYQTLRSSVLSDTGDNTLSCRDAQEVDFYSLYGSFLFLGLFLGALFLMATVLIIYYKQISEGYEDKERFAIMEKVGMSQQQVRTAIRSQVRMVFFLPLLGAIIHLAASFKMISKLMAALGLQNIPLFALCCVGTVAAFAVGYFIIYHLTARTYYKIVR
ncbi:FtsX-like permease family protein [Evtepia sp.]|uniref:FtsX-like permease family protein n=1 Tax=Evtepia sp. TaxID=2773933 RepID=UPI002E767773|nr:FtsX-like permease family protein [Evtepia sp.]MEE0748433.1 FtsX-like permease family protein [Evtepia sp.]